MITFLLFLLTSYHSQTRGEEKLWGLPTVKN